MVRRNVHVISEPEIQKVRRGRTNVFPRNINTTTSFMPLDPELPRHIGCFLGLYLLLSAEGLNVLPRSLKDKPFLTQVPRPKMAGPDMEENNSGQFKEQGEWAGDYDPLTDKEERRVLFAALDSFR